MATCLGGDLPDESAFIHDEANTHASTTYGNQSPGLSIHDGPLFKATYDDSDQKFARLPFPFPFSMAYDLYELYTSGDFSFITFDRKLLRNILDEATSSHSPFSQDDLAEIGKVKPDLYALILVVIASALETFPTTYAITIGVVESEKDLSRVIGALDEAILATLAKVKTPTFEKLQALNLYQHALSHR